MAEKRKLQGDIDRVLKKVLDGRTSFKEILEKFESATQNSQKEKFETELKKEIKKLQRLRDTIKTWLQSGEVKDKSALIEARKSIENDMEKFKVIEKETKTKAYSKEGLYTETKKDPIQKEKEEDIEWLRNQILGLKKKVEEYEFEILTTGNTKRKKNTEKEKIADINKKIGITRFHLTKLETMMRLLDNDKLELEKIREFKYGFEDYMTNTEAELYKSDQGAFIYDELNLDELSVDITIDPDVDVISSVAISKSDTIIHESTAPILSVAPTHIPPEKKEEEVIVDETNLHTKSSTKKNNINNTTTIKQHRNSTAEEPIRKHSESTETTPSSVVGTPSVKTVVTPVEMTTSLEPTPSRESILSSEVGISISNTDANHLSRVQVSAAPPLLDTTPTIARPPTPVVVSCPMPPPPPPPPNETSLAPPPENPTSSNTLTFDLLLDPGDAMSPFRHTGFKNSEQVITQTLAIDTSRSRHQSSVMDTEKARMIIPKLECAVPESFPKEPPLQAPLIAHPQLYTQMGLTPTPQQTMDEEDYYSRLDSDTLFFIFYYFEGTRAQYLAAKALKKMSWRFHTGHMCWFQRHEEPKKITENSESGTYIFYDYESMMRQKKENFTFSYNFLEDNDF